MSKPAFSVYITVFILLILAASPLSAREITLSPGKRITDGLGEKLLANLLEHGETAIVELKPDGELKQVTLISLINAPADKIFKLITTPEEHEQYINNVAEVNIQKREKNRVIYDYEIKAPLNNIDITLDMRLYPPYKIDSVAIGGDVKTGRYLWELKPLSKNKTIALYSSYTDISEMNFLMRQIMSIEKSLEFSVNVTATLAGIVGIKRKAEGRELSEAETKERTAKGRPAKVRPLTAIKGIENLNSLLPLMGNGYLLLLESYPDGSIRQTSVVRKVKLPRKDIYEVVARPEDYPKYITKVPKSEIESAKGNIKIMNMTLDMPIVGGFNYKSSFLMKKPRFILNKALSGDINNAKWLWEFEKTGDGETIIAYSFYSDLREASWFLRVLFSIDPTMEQGANIAGGIATVNIMAKIAEMQASKEKNN